MRQEVFVLTYGSGGAFTHGDLLDMERVDREGYMKLLVEQKKAEEEEIAKARRSAKRGARRPRTRRR